MNFELSLVESGVVDAAAFCSALRRRIADRAPLGQIAIEEGCLSPLEVRSVLTKQRESAGRRFGEVALDLGLLDRDRVASLLLAQSERERDLLDYLIEDAGLSADELERARECFRDGGAYAPDPPAAEKLEDADSFAAAI